MACQMNLAIYLFVYLQYSRKPEGCHASKDTFEVYLWRHEIASRRNLAAILNRDEDAILTVFRLQQT